MDESVTVEHARDHGHTHLFEVLEYEATGLQNYAIMIYIVVHLKQMQMIVHMISNHVMKVYLKACLGYKWVLY